MMRVLTMISTITHDKWQSCTKRRSILRLLDGWSVDLAGFGWIWIWRIFWIWIQRVMDMNPRVIDINPRVIGYELIYIQLPWKLYLNCSPWIFVDSTKFFFSFFFLVIYVVNVFMLCLGFLFCSLLYFNSM